ncbi:YigZ family protein [Clostridia bacterium]|nr:YigZ family protein [Clostridia bacterium]
MAADYLCPASFGEAEFVERRSKFIGRVWPVENEAEALDLIKSVRERHWDATHNCYAFLLREGGASRHSDNGEPSGTAGAPILEVLTRSKVTNALCVVTRYFGGVLLGAGGLVRAYSHSAKIALAAAGTTEMTLCAHFSTTVPYALLNQVRGLVSAWKGTEDSAEYLSEVIIRASVPIGGFEEFSAKLRDLSAGAVSPRFIGERYK